MDSDFPDRLKKSAVGTLPAKVAASPEIPLIQRVTVSHAKVVKQDLRNREFRDFNALGAEFESCDFRYSIFERAYFRDARFTNCRFDGARFIDCNLKSANFYRCDLKFSHFRNCLLEVREIIASLPAEPNIRREGLKNLKANAIEVGDHESVGLLVLQEIEAAKRHYHYAMKGYDAYYRNKYSTVASRIQAGARLLWLTINGAIWGHGEKPWRLLFSCSAILLLLGLVNFWSVMPRVGWAETYGGARVFRYIFQLFLDMSPDSRFQGFEAVDYIAVIMRYIYIGLFISVLYKSISHR
jgi:Pentapeptide repeats (9 copies)